MLVDQASESCFVSLVGAAKMEADAAGAFKHGLKYVGIPGAVIGRTRTTAVIAVVDGPLFRRKSVRLDWRFQL